MSIRSSLAVVGLVVPLVLVACSGGSTSTTGGTVVACRQKADSDTDSDCKAMAGRPRKLDCDASQTDAALTAGCVREKAGDNDVCCPLGVSGQTPTTSTGQVACEQKAGADGDKDCSDLAASGLTRKLDCDSDQTASALAAGCQRINATGSDVCCPPSVSGQTSGTPSDGGSTSAAPQAIVDITLSGATGCASTVFSVGSFSPDTPVANGGSSNGAPTSVTCTVVPAGTPYSVVAKVVVTGRGSFDLTGSVNGSAPAGTMSGTYTDAAGKAYPRTGCAVTYPASGGVADGRFFATLVCPATGSGIPDSCVITTKVKLENCR